MTAENAELRAAATALVGLLDAALALYPWVERVVGEAGGELPKEHPMWNNWPEGDTSVRGAAYIAGGGLGNQLDVEMRQTADELHVLLRRLNEA